MEIVYWILLLVFTISVIIYGQEKEKLRKSAGHTGKPYTWGSSAPSWKKRLAKNPDFFKTFSPGGIR